MQQPYSINGILECKRRGLIILGNGWVVRNCYMPAAILLGFSPIVTVDFPIETESEKVEAILHSRLKENPDALIVIATPNFTHWPLVKLALLNGNKVLCEKPLLLPSQLDLVNWNDNSLDRLFVSTPYRFRDDIASLRSALSRNTVGTIKRVIIEWRRRTGIPRPGSWYTYRCYSGGGALIDLGPHVLDLALLLMGWPELSISSASCGTDSSAWTKSGSRWMPSDKTDELSCDVETTAKASFDAGLGREIEIVVSWVDDVQVDQTLIKVEGSLATIHLHTLLGYAPGVETALMSLDGRTFYEEHYLLVRRPSKDFGRMLTAVSSGGDCGTACQGLQVMQAIAQVYTKAERNV